MKTSNGDMPAMYVLRHKSGQYFAHQNLYLGIAEMTSEIDEALQMHLGDAESKHECMREQEGWKIFKIEIGIRLGGESTRHLVRKRKMELEKELAELDKAGGE